MVKSKITKILNSEENLIDYEWLPKSLNNEKMYSQEWNIHNVCIILHKDYSIDKGPD